MVTGSDVFLVRREIGELAARGPAARAAAPRLQALLHRLGDPDVGRPSDRYMVATALGRIGGPTHDRVALFEQGLRGEPGRLDEDELLSFGAALGPAASGAAPALARRYVVAVSALEEAVAAPRSGPEEAGTRSRRYAALLQRPEEVPELLVRPRRLAEVLAAVAPRPAAVRGPLDPLATSEDPEVRAEVAALLRRVRP